MDPPFFCTKTPTSTHTRTFETSPGQNVFMFTWLGQNDCTGNKYLGANVFRMSKNSDENNGMHSLLWKVSSQEERSNSLSAPQQMVFKSLLATRNHLFRVLVYLPPSLLDYACVQCMIHARISGTGWMALC